MTIPTHQSIAMAVKDHGIDTIFGLMGDANLFACDHFVRGLGGTFVPVAIEGSAVLMAQAWGWLSGKIGVASVTHGPALTNCVTALTEATRCAAPLVLLAGDTPVAEPGHSQNIDQREVVAITGAGWEPIRKPETAAQDIARAFYRARVERRPIVVNMPAEFMWTEVTHQRVVLPVFGGPVQVTEGDDLDQAVGMIASARRPLILAGEGAIAARDSLIALADRLEAPLATTLKAIGLFEGHPANIGLFGTLSTPAAYDVIGKADCIIAFGAGLRPFTTDRGKLTTGKRIVAINDRAHEVARHLHPDAGIVADAGQAADTILWWLNEAEVAPSGVAPTLGPDLLHHPRPPARARPGTVDFVTALERLDAALPQDRVLSTDGGRFMTEVWCRVHAPGPRSFLASTAFGSIGLGLQQAVGLAQAAGGRCVVLFTGDGGFMMGGLTEFNTAVRMGHDLIVVVCNDAAYGAEHIQMTDRGMDPGLTTFDWPSFAAVAQALGGQGVCVRSEADLDRAVEAIATRKGPLLIELCLDPEAVPRMRL